MKNIEDVTKGKCHVHFVGIGGISMSGLAEILLNRGYTVTGSDIRHSVVTDTLESKGAVISYSQVYENISDDTDYIVYTAAVKQDNPEMIAAKDKDIATMTRAELLGFIMKDYKTAISVAGTHGKTTTTSMISEIMMAYDMDPTILVGGILKSIGGNYRIGHSDNLITEACEYTNSFLSFFSTINVILNVKEDHLDFFKDIDDIRNSFKIFANKLPKDGTLVINTEIDDMEYFTKDLDASYVTFGLKDFSDYYPANVSYNAFACASFDVMNKGDKVSHIDLKVPGEHNMLNALAAYATAKVMGVPDEFILKGLDNYNGTDRRFQYKGTFKSDKGTVTVIDDYAHHPDEIEATLTASRNYPHNKLWVVFQPHTFTRTKALMDRFASSLTLADNIVLAKIYPARETDDLGISSDTLREKINSLGKEALYLDSFEKIKKFLINNCEDGDLLITMGAGDVVNIGDELVK